MLHSEHRILTTHTGSLPRPLALTTMYARRAGGESIDEAALDAAGKLATRHVVRKQVECGVDVGNNGEQMREAFFLYVRRRMSGFGGNWNRKPMADIVKYPGFAAWGLADNRPSVSNRDGVPEAIGAVEYLDPALVRAECDEFTATLQEIAPSGLNTFSKSSGMPPTTGAIAAICAESLAAK